MLLGRKTHPRRRRKPCRRGERLGPSLASDVRRCADQGRTTHAASAPCDVRRRGLAADGLVAFHSRRSPNTTPDYAAFAFWFLGLSAWGAGAALLAFSRALLSLARGTPRPGTAALKTLGPSRAARHGVPECPAQLAGARADYRRLTRILPKLAQAQPRRERRLKHSSPHPRQPSPRISEEPMNQSEVPKDKSHRPRAPTAKPGPMRSRPPPLYPSISRPYLRRRSQRSSSRATPRSPAVSRSAVPPRLPRCARRPKRPRLSVSRSRGSKPILIAGTTPRSRPPPMGEPATAAISAAVPSSPPNIAIQRPE